MREKETKERATPVSRYTAVRARRVEFDGKKSSDCCYSFLIFIIQIFRIIQCKKCWKAAAVALFYGNKEKNKKKPSLLHATLLER